MIRSYRSDDRAAIEGLIVDFQEYECTINPDWRPGNEIAGLYLDYLLDHVGKEDGVMIVAEIDGKLCGYAAAWIETTETQYCSYIPSFWRLSDIYVDSNSRKQGVGGALMAEVERCAKEKGQTQIVLDVLAQNSLARDMYFKLGFFDYEILMVKKLFYPCL